MVNPLDLQRVERAPDVLGRTLLAGVRHQPEPECAATREYAGKLFRRMAALARRQPDADDLVALRQHLLQRFESRVLIQVTQEAHDQRGADAKIGLGRDTGAMQPVDHHRGVDAMGGMRLCIKKYLGVQHAVGAGTRQIGMRHVVEILLGAQHRSACVVQVEETLQPVKHIGALQRGNVRIGERNAVAPRKRKDQFRLQRALDMHVQFGLGHAAQQVGQALGRHWLDYQLVNSQEIGARRRLTRKAARRQPFQ